MERRITAHVLQFLLEYRFESKAEMARQLGMQPRTLEKVFANMEEAKASTTAFSKAIYYCARHRISLDRILEEFIEEAEGGIAIGAYHQRACQRLEMGKPKGLSEDGEAVFSSMQCFLQKASAQICPQCETWCNPWDGSRRAEQMDCYIGYMAREIVKAVSEFYTEREGQ